MDRETASCLKILGYLCGVFSGGHQIEVVQVCFYFNSVGFVGGNHCVKVNS